MNQFNQLAQQGTLHAWFYIPTAILLGALHGLEPGHSKTMMAAFIIAIRGTVFQAVLLGLCAAFSHSLVIWLLAALALHYGSQWNAEGTEPYFQIGSAVTILGLALWMAWRTHRDIEAEAHHHAEHDHEHGHEHSHEAAEHGHEHSHQTDLASYQDAHELVANRRGKRESGLGRECAVSRFCGRRVGDIDVIGRMTRHELILTNTMQHDMHHRPLLSNFLPAPVGLFLRQRNGCGTP